MPQKFGHLGETVILACGTCAHWLLWTTFPAATPWAITFTIWFLALSLARTVSRVELAAVPRLPAAVALVFGSVILGVAILGPLAGLWFAPSCLLGSAAAVRLGSQRPGVRREIGGRVPGPVSQEPARQKCRRKDIKDINDLKDINDIGVIVL